MWAGAHTYRRRAAKRQLGSDHVALRQLPFPERAGYHHPTVNTDDVRTRPSSRARSESYSRARARAQPRRAMRTRSRARGSMPAFGAPRVDRLSKSKSAVGGESAGRSRPALVLRMSRVAAALNAAALVQIVGWPCRICTPLLIRRTAHGRRGGERKGWM